MLRFLCNYFSIDEANFKRIIDLFLSEFTEKLQKIIRKKQLDKI